MLSTRLARRPTTLTVKLWPQLLQLRVASRSQPLFSIWSTKEKAMIKIAIYTKASVSCAESKATNYQVAKSSALLSLELWSATPRSCCLMKRRALLTRSLSEKSRRLSKTSWETGRPSWSLTVWPPSRNAHVWQCFRTAWSWKQAASKSWLLKRATGWDISQTWCSAWRSRARRRCSSSSVSRANENDDSLIWFDRFLLPKQKHSKNLNRILKFSK